MAMKRSDGQRVPSGEAFTRLRSDAAFAEMLRRVREGASVTHVTGPTHAAQGWIVAALAHDTGRPVLAVTADLEAARHLSGDAGLALGSNRVGLLPDRDLAPYEPGPLSPQLAGARLEALSRLPDSSSGVTVTTVAALHEALPEPSRLKAFEFELNRGRIVDREDLLHRLAAAGYRRVDLVEIAGEFSVRGSIVDVACPAAGTPVRFEFDGETVSSIRAFDPVSQRSMDELPSARIGAAAEALLTAEERLGLLDRLPDPLTRRGARRIARLRERLELGASLEGEERYLPWVLANPVRLPAYLPKRSLVVLVEPSRLREVSDRLQARTEAIFEHLASTHEPVPRPEELTLPAAGTWRALAEFPQVHVRQFSALTSGPSVTVPSRPLRYGPREFGAFLRDLERWSASGAHVLVAHETEDERRDLARRVQEESEQGRRVHPVTFAEGSLSEGAELTEAGLVLLPAREVLGAPLRRRPPRRVPKSYRDVFAELRTGEPVVHEDYGIGLYRGILSIPIEGVKQDFFLIEYADAEKLYLPVDQVHLVQKYLGGGSAPPLSRLGTEAWERTKARVKASLRVFAEGLLKLYAARQVAPGSPFPAEAAVEEELVRSFPYEETPDQQRAIEEVSNDLERGRPMDRVVCGDVGYGKTEVALRAAFRVAMQGAQAAVLVPTTVLAQQHYQNFRQRMAQSPIRVALLTRFRSSAERAGTLARAARGEVDILIGTHHLLSKSLRFRQLGLLIIDEEHRFGVKQKERLKDLRRNVHVLTLSATPIPRTLNMGLSGLRDLSLIETPPPGRLSVVTHVHEENPAVVREAILREVSRGGQVFYLHNRVQSIAACAEKLRELVPEVRLTVGHGQMPQRVLERAMGEFGSGRVDVLVCTSIIGSGLDLPNANTLIVERAELFGLADLYQLRGRVGRSARQAYAYFFFSPKGSPTLDARRRLAAMLEFGELGSGFRLAVRDMEIRGAGNLLGPQQHGVMHAVGFDLYSRLLESAVRDLKGERVVEAVPPQVNLGIEAYLPEGYVTDGRTKLEIYKRLAATASDREREELRKELTDRYGGMPRVVERLFQLADLRRLGQAVDVGQIVRSGGRITVTFRSTDALKAALKRGRFDGWSVSERALSRASPPDVDTLLKLLLGVLDQRSSPSARSAERRPA